MIQLDVLQPWPLNSAEWSAIVAIALLAFAMVALVTLPALGRLFGLAWVRHVAAFGARLAKAWPSRVRHLAPVLMLTHAPQGKRRAVRGPNGRFVRADALPYAIADYEGARRAKAARSASLPRKATRRRDV